jgi:glycosyltransferase involved in cell wall biosynthesis
MPLVSIVVPTFNRRKYIPKLLRCFDNQTYPQNKMELVIADDGGEPVSDLLSLSRHYQPDNPRANRIVYHRLEGKYTLGRKRNFLNRAARGDYIICMDDDDWYSPDYVRTMVKTLKKTDKLICGASRTYCYFADLKRIVRLGPYGPNQSANAIMGYKRAYLDNHAYNDELERTEEVSFTNNFTEPLEQIQNSEKIFLSVSHRTNTFDRHRILDKVGLAYDFDRREITETERYRKLRRRPNFAVKLTSYKLAHFIRDKHDLQFYLNL